MCLLNSIQMFQSFCVRNPHLFGNISFHLFIIKNFQKLIGSTGFLLNISDIFVKGQFRFFVQAIFNFSHEIGSFGLTWRVTLLYTAICRPCSQKLLIFKRWVHLLVIYLQCLLCTFDQCNFFLFFFSLLTILNTKCNSVQERVNNARTPFHLVLKIYNRK